MRTFVGNTRKMINKFNEMQCNVEIEMQKESVIQFTLTTQKNTVSFVFFHTFPALTVFEFLNFSFVHTIPTAHSKNHFSTSSFPFWSNFPHEKKMCV